MGDAKMPWTQIELQPFRTDCPSPKPDNAGNTQKIFILGILAIFLFYILETRK
jgi:hypothetical protein